MKSTATKFRSIDRTELKQRIDRKEKFHLWNVLDKNHYNPERTIPGSKWIPFDTLDEKQASRKVPAKSETIVVYCDGGNFTSTKKAADKLSALGYTEVFAYEGGLEDWSKGGLPLVKA